VSTVVNKVFCNATFIRNFYYSTCTLLTIAESYLMEHWLFCTCCKLQ